MNSIRLFAVVSAVAVTAVAQATGVPATAYVQDGLIAHFDAIDNEGTGTHNPTATKWKSLKGSASLTVNYDAKWGDRCLDTGCKILAIENMPAFDLDAVATDLAVNIISNGPSGSYPRLFRHIGADGIYSVYFSGTGSTAQMFINGSGTRPSAGTFRNGTLGMVSDDSGCRMYNNGERKTNSTITFGHKQAATSQWALNGNGSIGSSGTYLHGLYRGLRHYSRPLTDEEMAYNALVDKVRYFAYDWKGGDEGDWATLANWTPPYGSAAAVPTSDTKTGVSIKYAVVTAPGGTTVTGALSLDESTLGVPEGSVVDAQILFVDGVRIKRGIYTGTGSAGEQVPWLTGAGVVRVANSAITLGVPSIVPTPDADGVYTFGSPSGSYGSGKSGGANYVKQWTTAEAPAFGDMAFPSKAKIKLVGGIVVSAGIPDDAELDVSGLERVFLTTYDQRPQGWVVPSAAQLRYVPGTVTRGNDGTNIINCSSSNYLKDPLELNGSAYVCYETVNPFVIAGKLSGTGKLRGANFNSQYIISGTLDFDGDIDFSLQGSDGSRVIIQSRSITGTLRSVAFAAPGSGSTYRYHTTYGMSFVSFEVPEGNDPLRIDEWKSGNGGFGQNTQGNPEQPADFRWWRFGLGLYCWNNNTVHINRYTGTGVTHFFADNKVYNATRTAKGNAYIEIDSIPSASTLYLSTNVYLTVGNVAAGASFDYTCESNAFTEATLDITNGCSTAAKVKARCLEMLPARLSGFKGTVSLVAVAPTDDPTAVRTYDMAIDFDKAFYNTRGCIGSGTLANAPAAGTINVTLSGTPKVGSYALFRFDRAVDGSGRPLFGNWTVNVAGHEGSQFCLGSGEDLKLVSVKRDETGVYLKVSNPGTTILLR